MRGYRKLNKTGAHRVMMLRNLTTDLIRYGAINTTEAKAKELTRAVAKMITLAKKGNLHARRQALSFITDKQVVYKLFEEIAPKYVERNGGYTRIYKLGKRVGDASPRARIELV